MDKQLRVKGVIPALMTSFDKDGGLDEKGQRALVRFLLSKKVDGLYITGSSGETFLMTGEERNRVVDIVMDEVNGQVPVIVHVGDIGTDKTLALARHARDAGAAALSSVPPFYFRFSNDEVFSYYKDVSEATPLPMIVYSIALAGLVDFDLIKRLATLENVRGIKYTATTHYELSRIKEEMGQDFMVYSGCDEMALSGMAFGADGIIGTFYNVIPEIYQNLVRAESANRLEEAATYQRLANEIIREVFRYPFFGAVKAMLAMAGHDAGYVRRPFASLTEEQAQSLRKGLIDIRNRNEIRDVEVLDRL